MFFKELLKMQYREFEIEDFLMFGIIDEKEHRARASVYAVHAPQNAPNNIIYITYQVQSSMASSECGLHLKLVKCQSLSCSKNPLE